MEVRAAVYFIVKRIHPVFLSQSKKVNTEIENQNRSSREQRDLPPAATSLQPAASADLWAREMVELQHEKGCELSMLKITAQQGGGTRTPAYERGPPMDL